MPDPIETPVNSPTAPLAPLNSTLNEAITFLDEFEDSHDYYNDDYDDDYEEAEPEEETPDPTFTEDPPTAEARLVPVNPVREPAPSVGMLWGSPDGIAMAGCDCDGCRNYRQNHPELHPNRHSPTSSPVNVNVPAPVITTVNLPVEQVDFDQMARSLNSWQPHPSIETRLFVNSNEPVFIRRLDPAPEPTVVPVPDLSAPPTPAETPTPAPAPAAPVPETRDPLLCYCEDCVAYRRTAGPGVPRVVRHRDWGRRPRSDARENLSSPPPWTAHPIVFFPEDGANLVRTTAKTVLVPRRYVSVELEVCGVERKDQLYRVSAACEKWKASVVYDGSLPRSGFEINTSPAKGQYFIDQLTEICKALRTSKAWVDARAGMHVHVDSRDMTAAQILRLIQVYAKIEDGLFMVVPDSRRRNAVYSHTGKNYCEKCAKKLTDAIASYLANPKESVYWGAAPDEKKKRNKYRTRRTAALAVYEGLSGQLLRSGAGLTSSTQLKNPEVCRQLDNQTGGNLRNATLSRYAKARYYALNLHAHFYRVDADRPPAADLTSGESRIDRASRRLLRDGQVDANGNPLRPKPPPRRGTIECRLAAGTTDPDKILPWVKLWDNLVHVATGWPTRDIDALPTDSFEALLGVAPDEDTRKWLTERREKFKEVAAAPAEDF